MRRLLTITLILMGCGDTGQEPISRPVFVQGTAPTTFTSGAWTVTLTQAQIAFGPVYFCATTAASSDLCPSAVGEIANAVVVDALDPLPQHAGTFEGFENTAQSAMFDFGTTWFSHERNPTSHTTLTNNAHFVGFAEQGATRIDFIADLRIQPKQQGLHVVQGASLSTRFDDRLRDITIRFVPQRWWENVDFEAFRTSTENPVHITHETPQASNAVTIGITANARPTFIFNQGE